MNKNDCNQETILVAEVITNVCFQIHTDYKEILEEIFQEHDQGIPYYDDEEQKKELNSLGNFLKGLEIKDFLKGRDKKGIKKAKDK